VAIDYVASQKLIRNKITQEQKREEVKAMTQRLKGKSAVVTGGGSGGIGRAVSLALAAEGAKVVVNDIGRDPDGMSIADKVVEEIIKAKGTAVANYDSVTTMQGGENIIKTATSNFGRIDILVNCAGNILRAPIYEMTEEQWNSIINVHLKGHFNCARAAAIEMMKQKNGRIINFSSLAATGIPGHTAYSAAKAGILGLTGALSGDLNEYGITVNVILPSADTKMFPGPRPKGRSVPTSQRIEPDYIAPLVAYLATDEARGVTGRYFYASGGDIIIYAKPLELKGETPVFLRKMGKWTIDELTQVIPSILGLG
jgi:NAD(P)-dependent dehydrogenase (short-subunit alcohol dehydrogenase family)